MLKCIDKIDINDRQYKISHKILDDEYTPVYIDFKTFYSNIQKKQNKDITERDIKFGNSLISKLNIYAVKICKHVCTKHNILY